MDNLSPTRPPNLPWESSTSIKPADRPSVTHLRMEWSKPDQFHKVLWQIAEEDRSTFNSFSLRVNGYREYNIFCSDCAAGAVFKCGDISSTTAGPVNRKSGNNSYSKSSTYFSIMIPSKNKIRRINVSLYGQHRFSGLIFLSNTTLKSGLLQRSSRLGLALTFIVLVLIVICAIGLLYRYRIVKAVFKPTSEIEDNVYESVRSNDSASQRIQPSSNMTPIQTEMTQRIPSSLKEAATKIEPLTFVPICTTATEEALRIPLTADF